MTFLESLTSLKATKHLKTLSELEESCTKFCDPQETNKSLEESVAAKLQEQTVQQEGSGVACSVWKAVRSHGTKTRPPEQQPNGIDRDRSASQCSG